jgi:hypothetical protein
MRAGRTFEGTRADVLKALGRLSSAAWRRGRVPLAAEARAARGAVLMGSDRVEVAGRVFITRRNGSTLPL